MTIRVVLGEDNYLSREGITRILEDVEDIELVATGTDLASLRDAVDTVLPDVVLTDIRMPPSYTDEGIRLAAELRSSHPGMGVVVLSQHAQPLYAVSLFESGSERRAYLLKERLRNRGELGRALREVHQGGSVVDPQIVDELVAGHSRHEGSKLTRLTPRELETLGLVAEGRSNAAIAGSLVITKRAVERHINTIFAKLELRESDDVNRRVTAALMYLAGSHETEEEVVGADRARQ
ncbi:MAG TPA: response regulator transcription factor [Gaiellales bacterium]